MHVRKMKFISYIYIIQGFVSINGSQLKIVTDLEVLPILFVTACQ